MAEGKKGYPTALATRRPFGLSLLAVLSGIYAVFLLLRSVSGRLGLVPVAHWLGGGGGGGPLSIFWGVGILLAGYSLWKGRKSGRRDFNLLLPIGILLSLVAIWIPHLHPTGLYPVTAVLQLIVCIGFLIILNTRPSRDYLRR